MKRLFYCVLTVAILGGIFFWFTRKTEEKVDVLALSQQTEQIALQIRDNTIEYVTAHRNLSKQHFNPFLKEGMFPNMEMVCNRQDNTCTNQHFIYTGKCNLENCLLNVAYAQKKTPKLNKTDVDYMINMQVRPNQNVRLWKRVCFYNTPLGQQVCDYLKERGWKVKLFDK